jgi:two-component system, NarL family, nitrate/nitrite response regulator NarL
MRTRARGSPGAGWSQVRGHTILNAMETHARNGRISVVVADDHPVYRDGLVRAITSATELELIGEAADGRQAELLIEQKRPDVALVDVKMPAFGGVELCERLIGRGLPTRVVMISAYLDPNLVARALRAGASAYLGKDASRDEICEELVRVGRGLVGAQVP